MVARQNSARPQIPENHESFARAKHSSGLAILSGLAEPSHRLFFILGDSLPPR